MPKPISTVPFLALTCCAAFCAFAQIRPLAVSAPSDEKIGGYLGQRLDACIAHNVKTTDGLNLTELFRNRTEKNTWQTEKARPIRFCDFASAGDTWKEESLYRVWLRIPLSVINVPYNPPAE